MWTSSRRWLLALSIIFVALLVCKYFWSLFLYPEVPFGYDAGIYRYLFLTHAKAFPPFVLPSMPEWAKAHPLGLFFFSTLFLKTGVPVDALIGWMWNLLPVVLSIVLAWTVSRSFGSVVGTFVLLASVLSVVQYEGFLMMYWKVYVAFLWCALAFGFFERHSRWWVVFGMLTIATHQQIGLLLGCAILSSIVVSSFHHRSLRASLVAGLPLLAACILGLLWYLPNHARAIGDVLPLLLRPSVGLGFLAILCLGTLFIFSIILSPLPRFWMTLIGLLIGFLLLLLPFAGYAPSSLISFLGRGSEVASGAFLTVGQYMSLSAPLLILGLFGLALLLKRKRESPWAWAAIWSALAIVTMFFFYRRFILPLDFFLLPCVAIALQWLFTHRDWWMKPLAIVLILIQGGLLFCRMSTIDPHVQAKTLRQFAAFTSVVEPGSSVVVLDNMAPWVVGFLPEANVGGPGIFESKPQEVWQRFLFGSHADREEFFRQYPIGTYFVASDVFRSYYPPEVQSLLTDSCLTSAGSEGLYRSICGAEATRRP
jgi:hypothetical protein